MGKGKAGVNDSPPLRNTSLLVRLTIHLSPGVNLLTVAWKEDGESKARRTFKDIVKGPRQTPSPCLSSPSPIS